MIVASAKALTRGDKRMADYSQCSPPNIATARHLVDQLDRLVSRHPVGFADSSSAVDSSMLKADTD